MIEKLIKKLPSRNKDVFFNYSKINAFRKIPFGGLYILDGLGKWCDGYLKRI